MAKKKERGKLKREKTKAVELTFAPGTYALLCKERERREASANGEGIPSGFADIVEEALDAFLPGLDSEG